MDRISFPKFSFSFGTSSSSLSSTQNGDRPPSSPVAAKTPKTRLGFLQEHLISSSVDEIPALFSSFVADIAVQSRHLFTKDAQAQLEAAFWLCLSKGHSAVPPSAPLNPSAPAAAGEAAEAGDVCGHVFGKSEIVYRCRTCGLDDACVLCARCFNPEAHQGHDVLYTVSEGNGCCDCGDAEAWKVPIGCKFHSPQPQQQQQQQSVPTPLPQGDTSSAFQFATSPFPPVVPGMSSLPDSVRQTVRAVLAFVAQQFRSVTFPKDWNTAAPPPHLLAFAQLPPDEARQLAVLVYNDEVNRIEDGIQIVMTVTGGTRDVAQARTKIIDAVGRAPIILSNNLRDCLGVCALVERCKFRCTVERLEDVFLQTATPVLLALLTRVSKFSPAHRRVLSEEVTFISPASGIPELLDSFILADMGLWKAARKANRDLIFATLLIDSPHFKEILGSRFVIHYPALMEYYLKKDPEHELSLVTFSLQLFATPSVVHHLTTRCDLLTTLLVTLRTFYAEAIPADPTCVIDCNHVAFSNQKNHSIFYDLKYVLQKAGVQQHIASDPKHLHTFLGFLALLQGMHPQVRALANHVEFESDLWIKIFSLSVHISRAIPLFAASFSPQVFQSLAQKHSVGLDWAFTTTRDFVRFWQITHSAGVLPGAPILQQEQVLGTSTLHTRFGDFVALPKSITIQGELAASFHHPLHWFLASLIRVAMASPQADSLDLAKLLKPGGAGDLTPLWVLEGPLRVEVMLSQVTAGLWRKNGLAMANQAYQYRSVSTRDQTFDNDLLITQACAAVLDPDHITSLLLDRFSLSQWFSSSPAVPPSSLLDESQVTRMAEEFLTLVIAIVNERWFTGHASTEDKIRTHLIQLLVAGPHLYSEITKKIDSEVSDHASFQAILNDVAERRLNATGEQEKFFLRDHLYGRFDPYFFHLKRSDREKGEEAVRLRRQKAKNPEPFIPPVLVPLRRSFAALEGMLHSKTLVQVLFYGLWLNFPGFSPSPPADGSPAITPIQSATAFDMCLHLITLALTHSLSNQANPQELFFHRAATLSFELPSESSPLSLIELLVLIRQSPSFPKEEDPRFAWIFSVLRQLGNDDARVQLSRLTPFDAEEDGLTEEERKKKVAKEHRERIMREMQAKQQSFLSKAATSNPDDYEDLEDQVPTAAVTMEDIMETEPCIYCRQPTDLASASFGILGYIQPSALLK